MAAREAPWTTSCMVGHGVGWGGGWHAKQGEPSCMRTSLNPLCMAWLLLPLPSLRPLAASRAAHREQPPSRPCRAAPPAPRRRHGPAPCPAQSRSGSVGCRGTAAPAASWPPAQTAAAASSRRSHWGCRHRGRGVGSEAAPRQDGYRKRSGPAPLHAHGRGLRCPRRGLRPPAEHACYAHGRDCGWSSSLRRFMPIITQVHRGQRGCLHPSLPAHLRSERHLTTTSRPPAVSLQR